MARGFGKSFGYTAFDLISWLLEKSVVLGPAFPDANFKPIGFIGDPMDREPLWPLCGRRSLIGMPVGSNLRP